MIGREWDSSASPTLQSTGIHLAQSWKESKDVAPMATKYTLQTNDHSRPEPSNEVLCKTPQLQPIPDTTPPLLRPGFQKPILIGKTCRRTQPPCIDKPRASMGMQRPKTSRRLSLVVEISLAAVAGDKTKTSITWRLRCDKADELATLWLGFYNLPLQD